MLYIAGRRATRRVRPVTDIQVFSNCGEVTLRVNGSVIGKMQPDRCKVCTFRNVPLQKGTNRIEVVAGHKKAVQTDSCNWILE